MELQFVIYIEDLSDWWNREEGPVWHTHCPRELKVYNNKQAGADNGGVLTKYGIIIESLVANRPDAVYNNVFWGNDEAGIRVETPNLVGAGEEIDNELSFNIFGSYVDINGLIGIQYTGGGGQPAYHFNGFFNNDDGHIIGAEAIDGNSDVVGDPLFVNVGTTDYHLEWSSPMINNDNNANVPILDPFGDFTYDAVMNLSDFNELGESVNRDVQQDDPTTGSTNDIGAYGGLYANGIIDHNAINRGPEEQDFGWDPYCVIDTDCDELDGTLRNDYYKASADFEIPQGDNLTIEPGTFIEHDTDVKFTVNGQLNANGDLDGPIYFTNLDENEWYGIKFTTTANAESNLEYCHISYADVGVRFMSVPDGNEAIPVTDCIVMNCSTIGIDIYNTKVEITGNSEAPTENNQADLENWLADEEENRWNTVRQIRGGVPSMGIKVSTEDEVTITGTKVYLCGNENAEDDFDETGIYLFSADIAMNDASILQNGNTGMWITFCTPDLNAIDDNTNNSADLKDNGLTVNETNSGNGAEIYVQYCGASQISADECDFQDVDQNDDPRSYAVWVDGSSLVDADNCYWGVEANNFNGNEGNFINNTARVVYTNARNNANNDNDWTADVSLYSQAKQLQESGRFSDAISLFERVISNDPNSWEAANSIRHVFSCYETGGLDMSDLREYYSEVIEEFDNTELCNAASLLNARTLIEERRFEDAQSAFNALAENGDNGILRGLAHVQSLELDLIIDCDQIDATTERDISNKIRSIFKEMRNLDTAQNESNLPKEFALNYAYPNPFNSTVTIGYALNEDVDISISIYDQAGRMVTCLKQGIVKAGFHNIVWNADDFTSGTYICRLESGNLHQSIKLTLVK